MSTVVTPRCSDSVNHNGGCLSFASTDPSLTQPCSEAEENNLVGDVDGNVNMMTGSLMKSGDPQREGKVHVSVNDVSSSQCVDESASGEEMGMLHNCGLLQNNCLSCLVGTTSTSDEKRKSLVSSPRKKPSLRLSFKWKDGQANPTICKHHIQVFSII